jgi:PmbA protein
MTQSLEELSHTLLQIAKRSGADEADTIAVQGTSVHIDVRAGALEQAERSEGIDIGLRVLVKDADGWRQSCVSSSDTSNSTLEAMAERAIAMAKAAPLDPYAGLAAADMLAGTNNADGLELFDPTPEPDPEALQNDAQMVEDAALSHDGISQVQSASAGYSLRDIHLATSGGFTGGYKRSDRAVSCVAIAGTGAFSKAICAQQMTSATLPPPAHAPAWGLANRQAAPTPSFMTSAFLPPSSAT